MKKNILTVMLLTATMSVGTALASDRMARIKMKHCIDTARTEFQLNHCYAMEASGGYRKQSAPTKRDTFFDDPPPTKTQQAPHMSEAKIRYLIKKQAEKEADERQMERRY